MCELLLIYELTQNPVASPCLYGISWSRVIVVAAKAIEEGNLDEVEDEVRRRGRKKRRRVDDDEFDEPEDKSCKKPKKAGRPPLEKRTPNPTKLTKTMKKLIQIVIEYRDR